MGLMNTVKVRGSVLKVDWRKNPWSHQGISTHISIAFGISDIVSAELSSPWYTLVFKQYMCMYAHRYITVQSIHMHVCTQIHHCSNNTQACVHTNTTMFKEYTGVCRFIHYTDQQRSTHKHCIVAALTKWSKNKWEEWVMSYCWQNQEYLSIPSFSRHKEAWKKKENKHRIY